MARITATKSDVLWSYAGTVASMASGFVLLPLLVSYLTNEQLGLWYVFLALSNFAQLFEFGFNPTFARNIVYCISGARTLSKEGCAQRSVQDGIDFDLLKRVIVSSKWIYGILATVVLIACATLGTLYIDSITSAMKGVDHWVSWGLFCVAIFINLYYLYSLSLLRGLGDVAGENRARFFSRVLYVLICGVTLIAGFGLIGASVGFLVSGISLRILAYVEYRKHREIVRGLKNVSARPSKREIVDTLSTVWHIAWQDGLVQFANYASTQAMSLICSACFGVGQTGSYSVCLQLTNALYNFAGTYNRSCFPMYQSSYANADTERMREIVAKGVSSYLGLYIIGVLGLALVVIPLVMAVRPSLGIDYGLFFLLAMYMLLYQQHSTFCSYIVSTNRIPYRNSFVITSAVGVLLTFLLAEFTDFGAYALVLGQALPQLAYNNWRWPKFVLSELNYTYPQMVNQGFRYWKQKTASHFSK